MDYLISREGYKIGYGWGTDCTPLDYMSSNNPKTITMPRGFRDMLRNECPRAWFELCNGRKVYGFRFRDIIEENFNR